MKEASISNVHLVRVVGGRVPTLLFCDRTHRPPLHHLQLCAAPSSQQRPLFSSREKVQHELSGTHSCHAVELVCIAECWTFFLVAVSTPRYRQLQSQLGASWLQWRQWRPWKPWRQWRRWRPWRPYSQWRLWRRQMTRRHLRWRPWSRWRPWKRWKPWRR